MSESIKCYLLAYDASTVSGLIPNQIVEYIKYNKNIEKWWHFIPNVYVLNSLEDKDFLIEMFTDFFGSSTANFIISPIDPIAFNGFLPKEAWTAFKSDIEAPFKEMRDQ